MNLGFKITAVKINTREILPFPKEIALKRVMFGLVKSDKDK